MKAVRQTGGPSDSGQRDVELLDELAEAYRALVALPGIRRNLARLVLICLVIACHATDPAAQVSRVSPATVTGAALAAIGDNGLFVLPSATDEGYQQMPAQQAQALAAAWLRSYAPMDRTQLEREHGGPLDFSQLQECRLAFARTPYQPLPPGTPQALRNFVAGKFLMTFCSGTTPAVSVSVSSSAVELSIEGDLIVFPREHGNEFVAYGIPAGFSGAPLSPEHAAAVAHSRTGRRVSEVPELWLRHAFQAPQNAVWRLRLESSVPVRSSPGVTVRETQEVFVATGGNATGLLLRGLHAALGDTPEPPPVLTARASPNGPSVQLPLAYRSDAPQGFAALAIAGAGQ